MKNSKRPTRRQKVALQAAKLVPENWLVFKTESRKSIFHIVNRLSGEVRIIPI